jgi:hypothetical protein
MIIHVFYMCHTILLPIIYIEMMKVCPSCPSSEDHYILREIML